MILKKVVKEIFKFGIYEVFYHSCFNLTGSFYYKTKMLIEKDKYYRNLHPSTVKEELEEQYMWIMNEKMDIDKPVNFNQYIQWLKIYDNLPIKAILSDKYAVRTWIANKIGEQYLIPLLGVWESFDEIEFASLPNKFCLKASNGCGMNYVIKDKTSIDLNKMSREIGLWLICPFYAQTLELQYKDICTKILAEEYIENTEGNLLDYKIHCFKGEPKFIQVIGNRDLTSKTGKEAYYNLEWKRNEIMYNKYEQYEYEIPRPQNLEEMIEIAKILSEQFLYVRVDLYNLNGQIKFGEMTFTPASGHGKWAQMVPDEWWK